MSTSTSRRRWLAGRRGARRAGARDRMPLRFPASVSARVLHRRRLAAAARDLPGNRGARHARQQRRPRVGSGARSPVVSLALARAARARASLADGAVSRRHPDRPRRGAGRAGRAASALQGRVLAPALRRASTGCSGTWWRRASPGSRRWRRASRARSSSSCRRWRGSSRRCRCCSRCGALFASTRRAIRAVRRRRLVRGDAGGQAADPRARRAARADRRRLLADRRGGRPCAGRWPCSFCRAACGRGLLLAIGIFCSLLILADVVYYRFFGDVLSTPAHAGGASDRATCGDRSAACSRPAWCGCVVDWPFAVWLAVRLSRRAVASALRIASRTHADRCGGCRGGAAGERRRRSAVPRVLASHAARSDVPRALGRRTARTVRLPRLRHVELRARARWLRRPATAAQVDEAVAWLRERAPLRAGGVGVRRGARPEPDRRAGGVAAGLRRRFHRRRPGGDAAPAPVDRRQPALHQRHRSDERRPHVGRRVHDDDVAAAARSRRGRVPLSRQSLRGAAAGPDRARLCDAVGGRVRARASGTGR